MSLCQCISPCEGLLWWRVLRSRDCAAAVGVWMLVWWQAESPCQCFSHSGAVAVEIRSANFSIFFSGEVSRSAGETFYSAEVREFESSVAIRDCTHLRSRKQVGRAPRF